MTQKIALIYKQNTDLIGSLAIFLCLVHCIIAPYIFLGYTVSAAIEQQVELPTWWGFIDSTLLLISIAAIYWSAKNSTSNWVKVGLYLNWVFITFLIVNEKIKLFHIAECLIFIPAISLIVIHQYNRKYCKCRDDSCCVDNH